MLLIFSTNIYADDILTEGTTTTNKEIMWNNIIKFIMSDQPKYSEYQIISKDKEAGQIILQLEYESWTGFHWHAIEKMKILIELKDNKYRISNLTSRVRFKIGNEYENISLFSKKTLTDMELDLEVIRAIFDNDEIKYTDIATTKTVYSEMLETTPKYLTPKDEKKGKVNPLYTKYTKIISTTTLIDEAFNHIKNIDIFNISEAIENENTF